MQRVALDVVSVNVFEEMQDERVPPPRYAGYGFASP